jgi:hypothetical protein
MEWAISFEQAEIRAQEIYEKIGKQRQEVAEGKGSRHDDESWRADLEAQIRAQGGVIKRRNGNSESDEDFTDQS